MSIIFRSKIVEIDCNVMHCTILCENFKSFEAFREMLTFSVLYHNTKKSDIKKKNNKSHGKGGVETTLWVGPWVTVFWNLL